MTSTNVFIEIGKGMPIRGKMNLLLAMGNQYPNASTAVKKVVDEELETLLKSVNGMIKINASQNSAYHVKLGEYYYRVAKSQVEGEDFGVVTQHQSRVPSGNTPITKENVTKILKDIIKLCQQMTSLLAEDPELAALYLDKFSKIQKKSEEYLNSFKGGKKTIQKK
jgi:hypothetical protein